MKTRGFNGGDVFEFCNIWSENAAVSPEFFRPADYGALEAFLFGSQFFDPKAVFVVADEKKISQALGFAIASFAPNAKKDALDRKVGVLYAPILSPSLSADDKLWAEELLTFEAENYFRAQGTRVVYAGGRPNGSPLGAGLYSPCSPPGLYETDPRGAIFERWGYAKEAYYNEFRVDINRYAAPTNRQFREAQNVYLSPPAEFWKSRFNWFDVNVYAQFASRQWLLTIDDDVLAGAITHARNNLPSTPPPSASSAPESAPSPSVAASRSVALSFLAVRRDFVGRSVGSVLLAGVVDGLKRFCGTGELCVVVPESDAAFCGFFLAHSFRTTNRFISRCKNLF